MANLRRGGVEQSAMPAGKRYCHGHGAYIQGVLSQNPQGNIQIQ